MTTTDWPPNFWPSLRINLAPARATTSSHGETQTSPAPCAPRVGLAICLSCRENLRRSSQRRKAPASSLRMTSFDLRGGFSLASAPVNGTRLAALTQCNHKVNRESLARDDVSDIGRHRL